MLVCMILCLGRLAKSNGMIPSRMYNTICHAQLGSHSTRWGEFARMLSSCQISKVSIHPMLWASVPWSVLPGGGGFRKPLNRLWNDLPSISRPYTSGPGSIGGLVIGDIGTDMNTSGT